MLSSPRAFRLVTSGLRPRRPLVGGSARRSITNYPSVFGEVLKDCEDLEVTSRGFRYFTTFMPFLEEMQHRRDARGPDGVRAAAGRSDEVTVREMRARLCTSERVRILADRHFVAARVSSAPA